MTPDAFTVSKVTGEITGRRVGTKLRLHSFLPNGPGICVQAMPAALRGRPCLTDDEARALLGESPGCPPLHGDSADRIVLLQSRPETVWAARERGPAASPTPRASDHVLARLGKPL